MLLINWYYQRYKLHPDVFDMFTYITQTIPKGKAKRISRFTDLPDEIWLIICEYLGPVDTLRAFLSNDTSQRFHQLIAKYRTNIDLSILSYSDFCYMTDIILPQLNPSNLTLNNSHIPCLISKFISSQNVVQSMTITSVQLLGHVTVDYSLLAWLSAQSKLNTIIIQDIDNENRVSTPEEYVDLRNFLFMKGLPQSVTNLCVSIASIALVLHNQLQPSTTCQLKSARLQLETVDDLQILLSKGLLGSISKLHISLKQKRKILNEQRPALFLHQNLSEFLLQEYDSGITFEEFTYFIRHMPMLEKLSVFIGQTQDRFFAHSSYFDDFLSTSIVELRYFARVNDSIEMNRHGQCSHRFPMKICCNMIYTIPWRWPQLHSSVLFHDYDLSTRKCTRAIGFPTMVNLNRISVSMLTVWPRVTAIKAEIELPFLELFPCLRSLKTKDATIIHSLLPSTLRLLELTDTKPFDPNEILSTLVHSQIYKFLLKRPIRDEQHLLNVLHQFPNVRFLSITLPITNFGRNLSHIFDQNNARLPYLISLEVYGGESLFYSGKPFEWLITHTSLKFRTTPFYVDFCYIEKRLFIWL